MYNTVAKSKLHSKYFPYPIKSVNIISKNNRLQVRIMLDYAYVWHIDGTKELVEGYYNTFVCDSLHLSTNTNENEIESFFDIYSISQMDIKRQEDGKYNIFIKYVKFENYEPVENLTFLPKIIQGKSNFICDKFEIAFNEYFEAVEHE